MRKDSAEYLILMLQTLQTQASADLIQAKKRFLILQQQYRESFTIENSNDKQLQGKSEKRYWEGVSLELRQQTVDLEKKKWEVTFPGHFSSLINLG